MVTTTTKTLNYSITKGNNTNSVNATITSTPGFNTNYLGKIPGILKLLELALAITALVLVAVERKQQDLVEVGNKIQVDANGQPVLTNGQPTLILSNPPRYDVNGTHLPQLVATQRNKLEVYLIGEVFFLCAHSVAIAVLEIFLIAYLFHTTSAMIIPKATMLENVSNLVLALLLLAAGIVEIVMVVTENNNIPTRPLLVNDKFTESVYGQVLDQPIRFAAAALALLNGLLLIGSFVLSRKELAGPKTL